MFTVSSACSGKASVVLMYTCMRTAHIFLKPSGYTMEAITHDARPTVTFPATEHHHRPLAGTPQPSSLLRPDCIGDRVNTSGWLYSKSVQPRTITLTIFSAAAVFTCIGALGTLPQPNGAPRQKVLTGFPLQMIFAKVKAENQQHLFYFIYLIVGVTA